jgi:glutathione S-transferase
MPPVIEIARHTLLLPETERIPEVAEDGRVRATNVLNVLERALSGREYLVGHEFSGADIMMGYFVMAVRMLGAASASHAHIGSYWERLASRPALQRALNTI